MKKRTIAEGELFQINPEHPQYPGQLIVCTEPKLWGCQGVLFTEFEFEGLVRYKGRAFLRVKFEDMEPIGKLVWVYEDGDDH